MKRTRLSIAACVCAIGVAACGRSQTVAATPSDRAARTQEIGVPVQIATPRPKSPASPSSPSSPSTGYSEGSGGDD